MLSQFSHSVVSDSLQHHGLQHARLPCPSPTARACSNSCSSGWWCHLTISSCHPLLLLSSILPSIRVFSNESVLRFRWPKYWSFSFSISPSNEYSGQISFRMDWLDLLAVPGTLKSLPQNTVPKKCYSVIKKVWNNATWYNILGRPLGHSNWRKSERKRQISYGVTYAENVKLIQNWKRLTDFKTQLSDTDGVTLEVRSKSESWS